MDVHFVDTTFRDGSLGTTFPPTFLARADDVIE